MALKVATLFLMLHICHKVKTLRIEVIEHRTLSLQCHFYRTLMIYLLVYSIPSPSEAFLSNRGEEYDYAWVK